MRTKKAIIFLHVSRDMSVYEIQEHVKQLNKMCEQYGFEMIRLFEYVTGNQRMLDEMKKCIQEQHEKTIVFSNKNYNVSL